MAVLAVLSARRIIVSVGYEGEDFVKPQIEDFMLRNKMEVVEAVRAEGYGQCYNCGDGHDCGVGRVVKVHGFLEKIKNKIFRRTFMSKNKLNTKPIRLGKSWAPS